MTYHITISDGTRCDIKAPSAAEAMQTALEKNLGRTVLSCFAGKTEGQQAGVIRFEIPAHVALTAAPEKKERKKRVKRTEPAAPWIEDFLATKKQNEAPPEN